MVKKYLLLLFIGIAAFCNISCKISTGNEEPSPTDNRQLPDEEGFFIDAPTCGLMYKAYPSGLCGSTGRNGRFSYRKGDEVTFYIGSMQLGYSVPCRRCISPLHIAKAASIYGNRESTILAQNIIRFLMALNTGKNPYGLMIPHINEKLYSYDLQKILCSPDFERDIIEIVAALRDMLPSQIVLPDVEEAQKHFLISESLINQLEEKTDKNLYISIKVPAAFKNRYIDIAFNADSFESPYFSGKKILADDNGITKYSVKLHEAAWQLTLTALQNNNGLSKNDLISFYTPEGFSNALPEGYSLEAGAEVNILHADLSEDAAVVEEVFIQECSLTVPKEFPDGTDADISAGAPVYLYLDILDEAAEKTAAGIELIIPVAKEQITEEGTDCRINFTTTLAKGYSYRAQVYYRPDTSKSYYVKKALEVREETGAVNYTFTGWDEEKGKEI